MILFLLCNVNFCSNILAQNGTAMDAALATMFCDGLYNMQSMGIGGGFLMTIYKKSEKKAYTLNAREAAPRNSTEDMFGEKLIKFCKGLVIFLLYYR